MSFKMDGFDELEKKLSQLEQNAKELDGQNDASFADLFNPNFITTYTNFNNLNEMFEKSPFTVKSEEDFLAIPDDEWEKYVQETTSFGSWEEMQIKANEVYTLSKLGL